MKTQMIGGMKVTFSVVSSIRYMITINSGIKDKCDRDRNVLIDAYVQTDGPERGVVVNWPGIGNVSAENARIFAKALNILTAVAESMLNEEELVNNPT